MLTGGWIDAELAKAFNPICEPWGALEPAAHVVGKHLLFGVLTYIDARLGTRLREMGSRELYLRIINHADLEDLSFLKEEIQFTFGNTPKPTTSVAA